MHEVQLIVFIYVNFWYRLHQLVACLDEDDVVWVINMCQPLNVSPLEDGEIIDAVSDKSDDEHEANLNHKGPKMFVNKSLCTYWTKFEWC